MQMPLHHYCRPVDGILDPNSISYGSAACPSSCWHGSSNHTCATQHTWYCVCTCTYSTAGPPSSHEIKTTKINSDSYFWLFTIIGTPENYPPYGNMNRSVLHTWACVQATLTYWIYSQWHCMLLFFQFCDVAIHTHTHTHTHTHSHTHNGHTHVSLLLQRYSHVPHMHGMPLQSEAIIHCLRYPPPVVSGTFRVAAAE